MHWQLDLKKISLRFFLYIYTIAVTEIVLVLVKQNYKSLV